MLHKTRGIVLHSIAYNDTYMIVPIYTEEFGLVSYMVSCHRNKKSRTSQSLYQPLSILDLETEHHPLRDLQKIKEARRNILLSELTFNPLKSAIALFIAEFIYNIAKESQANQALFSFLLNSLQVLNLLNEGIANFHLVFMIRTSRFLGFYPNANTYDDNFYFDMADGIFVKAVDSFHPYLNIEESRSFRLLLRMNYENMSRFHFSRHDRVNIIYHILEFYRLHLASFPELKSLSVLQEVFN